MAAKLLQQTMEQAKPSLCAIAGEKGNSGKILQTHQRKNKLSLKKNKYPIPREPKINEVYGKPKLMCPLLNDLE